MSKWELINILYHTFNDKNQTLQNGGTLWIFGMKMRNYRV